MPPIQLTPGSMFNLLYCARHGRIITVLKMFYEILKIAQDYDNFHPTRVIEETIFFSNLGGDGEKWCCM